MYAGCVHDSNGYKPLSGASALVIGTSTTSCARESSGSTFTSARPSNSVSCAREAVRASVMRGRSAGANLPKPFAETGRLDEDLHRRPPPLEESAGGLLGAIEADHEARGNESNTGALP